jgi:hypothetical protein
LVFAVVGDSRRETNLYTQLLGKVVEDGNMLLVNTGIQVTVDGSQVRTEVVKVVP